MLHHIQATSLDGNEVQSLQINVLREPIFRFGGSLEVTMSGQSVMSQVISKKSINSRVA